MAKGRGPQFLRFCRPLIEVLKEMGGSGAPSEVTDAVIEKLSIPEEEQLTTLKNGTSRIRNQVAWARFYLARSGYLDSSERGVWTLTEKGLAAPLTPEQVSTLFKEVQRSLPKGDKQPRAEETKEPELEAEAPISEVANSYRAQLLETLMSLSPSGFERICQRLLREAGFAQVVVTGRSGDGGLDGHGILQLNPFVTFKVMFQCKRYQGTVSAPQVRDFRGAMLGRADKGIILTTGTFTTEATKEARRDGVPPIELVDGQKLLEMFESLELGLKPKKTYEVDREFFAKFGESDT
jgi:restriction system protein